MYAITSTRLRVATAVRTRSAIRDHNTGDCGLRKEPLL